MLRVYLRFEDQTGCYCVLEPRPAVCQVMQKKKKKTRNPLKPVKCRGDVQQSVIPLVLNILSQKDTEQ